MTPLRESYSLQVAAHLAAHYHTQPGLVPSLLLRLSGTLGTCTVVLIILACFVLLVMQYYYSLGRTPQTGYECMTYVVRTYLGGTEQIQPS